MTNYETEHIKVVCNLNQGKYTEVLQDPNIDTPPRTFKFGGCRIDNCKCYEHGLFPCEKPGSLHEGQVSFDGGSVIVTS